MRALVIFIFPVGEFPAIQFCLRASGKKSSAAGGSIHETIRLKLYAHLPIIRTRTIQGILIIGLAGPSGSGKSTAARQVALRLDGCTLSMETYSLSADNLSFDERVKQNYDEPDAIDIELLESHIRRFRKGLAIDVPIYDFAQHLRLRSTQHVTAKPVVIVEGILALHFPELRQYYDLAIYFDAPDSVCFHRRKVRDITERQRPSELVQWQYENMVLPAAQRYLPNSKKSADRVLNANQGIVLVEDELHRAILNRCNAAAGKANT